MAREPFNRIWTETPTVDDFDEPTEAMWDAGWRGGADQDPPEAFAQNWWQNRVDFALQDLEREGAMEWLSTVPYEMWAFARGSNGTVYIAIQSNVNVDPTTDDGTNWLSIPDYIKSRLNASGDAPLFGVRAWGSFNGSGGVVINASGNISSITRVDPGVYDVLFDEQMIDENYSVSFGGSTSPLTGAGGAPDTINFYLPSSGGFRIQAWQTSTQVGDLELITFQVVR